MKADSFSIGAVITYRRRFITNRANFCYYKSEQLLPLQIEQDLLQIGAAIIHCCNYYKLMYNSDTTPPMAASDWSVFYVILMLHFHLLATRSAWFLKDSPRTCLLLALQEVFGLT